MGAFGSTGAAPPAARSKLQEDTRTPTVIVDPPDGKIPYKPEALARRDENYRSRATADPSRKCYQAGVPRATYLATPLQILQSPGNFAIVYEENHAFRVFHTDDRPHLLKSDYSRWKTAPPR